MKLYTPLISEALKIAYDAHHGQLDKGGVPYIFHPVAVAEQMDTEEEIVTALLHDVLEDTTVTLADLKLRCFPQTVLEALKLLKHGPEQDFYSMKEYSLKVDEDYFSYLREITANPLALKVKLADIHHNNDATCNALLSKEKAEKHKRKYDNARGYLTETAEKHRRTLQGAADGVPEAMFELGIDRYWGHRGPCDRREAFWLLSEALIKGLEKEPGVGTSNELGAAGFLVAMLLDDDDGILSERTEPFWFEKPFETASELDKVFMYATGRGAERDLDKAEHIAWLLTYEFFRGSREIYADDRLFVLLRDTPHRERGLCDTP